MTASSGLKASINYEKTRERHGLSLCRSCRDPDCRMEFMCERCGKWRGYCVGHSEGNECIMCEEELRQKLIAFVKSSRWGFRRESALRQHILGTWRRPNKREPTMNGTRVDDMLFELVLDELLTWDPPQDKESAGSEDIKYRVGPGIRKEKEKPHDRKSMDRVHVHRQNPRTGASGKRRPKAGGARKRSTKKPNRVVRPAH